RRLRSRVHLNGLGGGMATGRNHRRARFGRRFRPALFLAAAAVPAAWPLVSRANTDTWNDGSGNWSTPGNWSLGSVPAAGDTVNLTQSDGTSRIVTYDAAATSGAGFAQLTIDATGSGSMGLSQVLGTLTVTGSEFVGLN